MITLPKQLTATKYPGYFWDTEEHKLYSIKVGGVLKHLKIIDFYRAQRFMFGAWRLDCDKWMYQVSVKGRKRYLTDRYLLSLTLEDSEIPFDILVK